MYSFNVAVAGRYGAADNVCSLLAQPAASATIDLQIRHDMWTETSPRSTVAANVQHVQPVGAAHCQRLQTDIYLDTFVL